MKWPARIAIVSLLGSAALVPFYVTRADSPMAPPSVRAVQVVHEDVVAVESVAAPAPAPATARRVTAAPAVRRASFPSKTRRVLLGDGTHRPEPFPRVK